MQREFKLMIAVTAFAGAMSVGGGPPTGTTMQAVPDEGLEPGDSFVVSNADGSECPEGEVTGDTGGIRPGQWVATMEEDGDWAVTIEIPENGPPDAGGNPTPFPPGDYEIHAFCDYSPPLVPDEAGFGAPAGQTAGKEYDPITVTVVAPTQDTTSSSTPTPTTAPGSDAAPAVVAAPTYTG